MQCISVNWLNPFCSMAARHYLFGNKNNAFDVCVYIVSSQSHRLQNFSYFAFLCLLLLLLIILYMSGLWIVSSYAMNRRNHSLHFKCNETPLHAMNRCKYASAKLQSRVSRLYLNLKSPLHCTSRTTINRQIYKFFYRSEFFYRTEFWSHFLFRLKNQALFTDSLNV